ncbi:hypothetical protein RJ55_07073 [Drechmeria coniospora]|nr:hypothetical protein RJ55_07073 [Drechmeria coniospora]
MDPDPQTPVRRANESLGSPPSQPARAHLGRPAAPTSTWAPDAELSVGDSFAYLEPLSQPPSQRSGLSRAPSLSRFPSLGTLDPRPLPESPRRPSIRIRPRSSSRPSHGGALPGSDAALAAPGGFNIRGRTSRPRSISQPTTDLGSSDGPLASVEGNSRRLPQQISLPRLTEEGSRPTTDELAATRSHLPLTPTLSLPEHAFSRRRETGDEARRKRLGRVSRLFRPGASKREAQAPSSKVREEESEYNEELVDWLDIIDPEVQALSTLTNVQNSLFIPDLGSWVNRRPTYVLSPRDMQPIRRVPADAHPSPADGSETDSETDAEAETGNGEARRQRSAMQRSSTITSRLTDAHYAALPHGRSLEGWTDDEKWELDDQVRHMLHSRRARFKRSMKGFGQYVRRPLGFFVTLYATLITLFGLAWVLFLIGWIYVGEKQVYAIHIIDSVLVALFAIMGDGLAPFRAIDTYHMFFVVRYSRMLEKAGRQPRLRLQKRRTPPEVQAKLASDASLAAPQPSQNQSVPPATTAGAEATPSNDAADVEDGKSDSAMSGYHSLTAKQRKSLSHHQEKLAKSHSFYKPEETLTHYSFPLGYLMAIVILLDCHSCLQISLGACTWGIDYHVRPFALTTVILCMSITCNLTAGLIITMGDRKTRKKKVLELLSRQALTEDAIRHIENRRSRVGGGGVHS